MQKENVVVGGVYGFAAAAGAYEVLSQNKTGGFVMVGSDGALYHAVADDLTEISRAAEFSLARVFNIYEGGKLGALVRTTGEAAANWRRNSASPRIAIAKLNIRRDVDGGFSHTLTIENITD